MEIQHKSILLLIYAISNQFVYLLFYESLSDFARLIIMFICLFISLFTRIPWNLSFRYILFHEKRLQMMLWLHNTRVNSHQRWKQTRFRVCFHLWCELTSTMNVTEWQVSWNSCVAWSQAQLLMLSLSNIANLTTAPLLRSAFIINCNHAWNNQQWLRNPYQLSMGCSPDSILFVR